MSKYVLAKVVYNDVSGVTDVVTTPIWDKIDPIILMDAVSDMRCDVENLVQKTILRKNKYLDAIERDSKK